MLRVDTNQMPRTVSLALLLALVVGLVGAGFAEPARAGSAVATGIVHGGLYSSVNEAAADLDALAAATGKRVTFGGTFGSTGNDLVAADPNHWSNTRKRLDEIWQAKSTPFYNFLVNTTSGQVATASQIANGSQDVHINRWIDHLQLYLNLGGGRNLILAPLQEMNGDWVAYGCTPTAFKNAYRRIHDMVRARGIDETKVRFAFAPNGWTSHGCGTIHDYYPGNAYVDVNGISAYRWSTGGSVQQVMGVYADQLAAAYPTKPIVIAQTAVWPSATKSQWIQDMFNWAAAHPHVVGIIYFNYNHSHLSGETDWRVWTPPSTVNAGWKAGMLSGSTAYEWPLTSWFQPGELKLGVKPGVNLCPPGEDCDTVAFQSLGGEFSIFTYATSGVVANTFYFGNPGDIAFSGDWNCNGTETLGLYRQSDGYVYLRNSNTQGNAHISFFFGNPGDIPIAGDFNGNGCDTVSIYRPSQGRFYIVNKLGSKDGGLGAADYAFYFGNPGDKPFVGDFNGNGTDSVGLHRESTGLVYLRYTNSEGNADLSFFFGNPGDVLIAGDWNGNGVDTVGVYRKATGMFFVRNSNSAGGAHSQVWVGQRAGVVPINP